MYVIAFKPKRLSCQNFLRPCTWSRVKVGGGIFGDAGVRVRYPVSYIHHIRTIIFLIKYAIIDIPVI